jgi:F0F1-type ATP synthase membrane subunit b/b'
MKSRIAILIVAAVALCPSVVFAAEGAEESGSWFALIFYAVNFAIFIYIVKRFAGPLVSGFFRDRAAGLREAMKRADAGFEQAQELANRAAGQIAKLEAEKMQIASDLAEETVYQVRHIHDLAQEAVARTKRDTEMTSAALRDTARRQVRVSLAEASGRLARALLERDFQPADQARLLGGFIDRLREERR